MKPTRNRLHIILLLLLLLVVGCVPGCKEGDSVTVPEPPAADFVEEAVPDPIADPHVSVVNAGSAGGQIVLDILVADDGASVESSAIVLHLQFPSAISRLESCSEGDLFGSSGIFLCEEDPQAPGSLFIVASGIGDRSVVIDGSQRVATVELLVFGLGSGAVEFVGQNLSGSGTSAILDTKDRPVFARWFGGRLEGR